MEPVQTFDSPRLVASESVKRDSTVLDELLSDLAEEAEEAEETVTYSVPKRPGLEVRFGANIPEASLKLWRRATKNKAEPLGVDQLRWSATVLANQCREIIRNGEVVVDAEGEPVGFEAFVDALGASSILDAVIRFYKRDNDVIKAAGAVLIAAGWDGDDFPDPTPAS
jgi:hypothetical protein